MIRQIWGNGLFGPTIWIESLSPFGLAYVLMTAVSVLNPDLKAKKDISW